MSEMCCTRLAVNTGRKKSPSAHHRTNSSSYIFATKARIDNREKNLLNSNISSTCPYNMVKFGPLAAEIIWRVLGTTYSKFQRVSRLGSVTARRSRHSSSGRQANFVALNRGRHLCSAGRPSRWALAHVLVGVIVNSDSQLVKDGATGSRRVKVTKAQSGNQSLRVHWISQDWGLSVRYSTVRCVRRTRAVQPVATCRQSPCLHKPAMTSFSL